MSTEHTAGEPRELDEARSWAAVAERDGRADGRFVYAVSTTGIFCRPSCPARRPRREHVRFFPTPEAARGAGFRACKRCRPDAWAPPPVQEWVARAKAYLDAHLEEAVTLDALSGEMGLSPSHLQRTFQREVGLSPKAYQDARRMERLRARLRTGDTVSRAAFEAGFGSSRAVYEKAPRALGMSPATYRRGAPGVTIRYATADTRFGPLLVAATGQGICFVGLASSEKRLAEELAREFPRAARREAADALAPWTEAILAHLHGSPRLDVPTDLSGTEFQRRVWRALREIPYGRTRSYREVAESLGRPEAARAVARACASNRAALVVPCHRVVRSDGGLGGYRWGTGIKRALLAQEEKARRGPPERS